MKTSPFLLLALAATVLNGALAMYGAEPLSKDEAAPAMRKAAEHFVSRQAVNGGYVYYTTPDLKQRWGEGKASPTQIFVQPPGTPAVGMAFLKAYAATGDQFYLEAARKAAHALAYGQLKSGGWMQSIDFDPKGPHVGQYRNGKGGGKNYSTLDDGIGQSALRFMMQADQALDFRDPVVHDASEYGKRAFLAAQLGHGGFPQVWEAPTSKAPGSKASYPTYDWRTEGKVKDYWNMVTLNDDSSGYIATTLIEGWEIYKDDRFRAALAKMGDFLLLAQMPEPQPGWAQQYDTQMRPIWARKFEPPAVAGRETQDVLETLIRIYAVTGDAKYLEPIPRALAFLKRSRLADGQLARYYELKSNKPLYMTADYKLTYDDSDVPPHYGWKTAARIEPIEAAYNAAKAGQKTMRKSEPTPTGEEVRAIVASLDGEGRWVSTYSGQRLVGQPKFTNGFKFISSEVFNDNLERLSAYIAAEKK